MKETILTQFQIQHVIDALDNAVDNKDWAKARTYFTERIYTDFSTLNGGEPAEMPADQLIQAWEKDLYVDKKTCHIRGNHETTLIDENTASDFSKAYAINAIDKGEVTGIWEVWGNYIYTLMKEGEDWKITGMSLYVIETRGDDAIRTYVPK